MTALHEALQRLSTGAVPVLAGGTDFYPALGDALPPPTVIDVRALPELRGITTDQTGAVVIGAGATWSDLIRTALPPAFDGLKAAAREVGSVQIQNRATLAGNLCTASPAADGVPPLLTLGADIELTSASGVRRLPLQQFLTGARRTARQPDELLTRIYIPAMPANTVGAFSKLGARRYLVISIAMIAITLQADDAGCLQSVAIAVGACSPVAQRLTLLEDRLVGCPLNNSAALLSAADAQCIDSLSPIDDVRASADYRCAAVLEALQRLLTHTASLAVDAAGRPT